MQTPSIRIFPDIWENDRFLDIQVFDEEEARPLFEFFKGKGIKVELITITENIET